jgi:tRNA 2-thiouridine synthesizing protein A
MGEALLDAKGLNCPLPTLGTESFAAGAVLRSPETERGFLSNFAAFCLTTGDELLAAKQDGQTLTFLIKLSARSTTTEAVNEIHGDGPARGAGGIRSGVGRGGQR